MVNIKNRIVFVEKNVWFDNITCKMTTTFATPRNLFFKEIHFTESVAYQKIRASAQVLT